MKGIYKTAFVYALLGFSHRSIIRESFYEGKKMPAIH